MHAFITALAWIFGITYTIGCIASILANNNYTDLQRSLDRMQGYEKRFPILYRGIIATICWAWVFTQ